MGSDTTYRLGIDGLPLGTHAAVSSDRRIAATFDIVDGSGRAVDLEHRIAEALSRAGDEIGGPVAEVRLVCVDDGAAGQHLDRIGDALRAAGIDFQVLDLVDSVSDDDEPVGCPSAPDTLSSSQRSLARARSAALW